MFYLTANVSNESSSTYIFVLKFNFICDNNIFVIELIRFLFSFQVGISTSEQVSVHVLVIICVRS